MLGRQSGRSGAAHQSAHTRVTTYTARHRVEECPSARASSARAPPAPTARERLALRLQPTTSVKPRAHGRRAELQRSGAPGGAGRGGAGAERAMQAGDAGDATPARTDGGGVELREDVPLKGVVGGGGAAALCGGGAGGGPRLAVSCFAALAAAVTVALLTQIYCGDYQVVPHGAVSAGATCARGGGDALRAGGRALDAALAAALCLAVAAPHRTSLDASGSLLYWDYRKWRTQAPVLVEWGAAGDGPGFALPGAAAGAAGPGLASGEPGVRPPRLLAALAGLHAQYGALPWGRLLQPAIDLARDGFVVTESLAQALAARGDAAPAPGDSRTEPELARYLQALQHNSSAELAAAWGGAVAGGLRRGEAGLARGWRWRVYAGGAGAAVVRAALLAALPPAPAAPAAPADAQLRAVAALRRAAAAGAWPPGGVAAGVAAVDRSDAYVALVTGLSVPFGSGPSAGDWQRDEPASPLDLAPALLADDTVCGTRYVVGAESSAALVQSVVALAAGGAAGPGTDSGLAAAVEGARVLVRRGGVVESEAARAGVAGATGAAPPYPAVHVVQQRGDGLQSHADSRGDGLAARF